LTEVTAGHIPTNATKNAHQAGILAMTADQYKRLASRATRELDQKQTALMAKYGIGTFASFHYDQTTGKLLFKNARGRVEVEAVVTPLGSFSSRSRTWRWAWANESVLAGLRQRATKVKELEGLTGKRLFQRPVFAASELKAWELAAVCVRHLRSRGCYRIPTRHLHVFLALDKVSLRSSRASLPKARGHARKSRRR
jgi:hypothetical protein